MRVAMATGAAAALATVGLAAAPPGASAAFGLARAVGVARGGGTPLLAVDHSGRALLAYEQRSGRWGRRVHAVLRERAADGSLGPELEIAAEDEGLRLVSVGHVRIGRVGGALGRPRRIAGGDYGGTVAVDASGRVTLLTLAREVDTILLRRVGGSRRSPAGRCSPPVPTGRCSPRPPMVRCPPCTPPCATPVSAASAASRSSPASPAAACPRAP